MDRWIGRLNPLIVFFGQALGVDITMCNIWYWIIWSGTNICMYHLEETVIWRKRKYLIRIDVDWSQKPLSNLKEYPKMKNWSSIMKEKLKNNEEWNINNVRMSENK